MKSGAVATAARLCLVSLALVGAGCAGVGALTGTDANMNAELASRQILLTVEQKNFSTLELSGAPSRRYLRRRGYSAPPPSTDRLLDQIAADHGIERKQGWPIESLEVYCEVFEVPDGADVGRVIERLAADPRVDLAQPMNLFDTLASGYDDPYVDLQPAAVALGVENAHRMATGKGVLVAVIDTAVDGAHPDLEGRVDLSRDLVDTRGRPAAAEVHGTAVAGIIASVSNNNVGIVGVAPDVRLAALRACWPVEERPSSARCSTFTLARALELAIRVQPAIVNLSLAGPADPLLSRLLDELIDRGIVVVAAEPSPGSGNVFPASHSGVFVAHRPGSGADDGSRYRLPAPADEILTTTPNAGYAFFSGTSLAAAHLTGVIALLMELAPNIGPDRLADLLTETTMRNTGQPSVNACRALERLADVRVCAPQLQTASRPADQRVLNP